MNASRIVAAQEAERLLRDLSTTDGGDYHLTNAAPDLAHTVVVQAEQIAALQRFVKQCEHDQVTAVPVGMLVKYVFGLTS